MQAYAPKVPKVFDGRAIGALSGTIDRFKGITINSNLQEIKFEAEWEQTLQKSIDAFKKEGLRAVWLKIPKQSLGLAGLCTSDEYGFEIHHAKQDYLMLTKWMDSSSESRLPGFATHYVGVGGLVLNKERTKLLCIQE